MTSAGAREPSDAVECEWRSTNDGGVERRSRRSDVTPCSLLRATCRSAASTRTGAAGRRRSCSTERLFARARADRRVARDANFAIGARSAHEDQTRTRRDRTASRVRTETPARSCRRLASVRVGIYSTPLRYRRDRRSSTRSGASACAFASVAASAASKNSRKAPAVPLPRTPRSGSSPPCSESCLRRSFS